MNDYYSTPIDRKRLTAGAFTNLLNWTRIREAVPKGALTWQGARHGSAPYGITIEGMIFTDEWSTFNYCSVQVLTVPTSGFTTPSRISTYMGGNVHIRPLEGDTLKVYNGKFTEEGPWVDRVLEIMNEIRVLGIAWMEAKKKDDAEKSLLRQEKHANTLADAISSFNKKSVT